jgi:protein-S-isoprenylcysteine O-methyltransferase Ste14
MVDHDSPNIRIPPPIIVLTVLVAGFALDGRITEPQLNNGWSILLGLVAVVIGFLVGGLALRGFIRAGTSPEPWKASTSLVERGVYRYTRNPMYLGMVLVSLGIAIVAGGLWSLLSVALIWGFLNFFVVTREESYLSRRFGSDYDIYRCRVRRWL